MGELKSKEAAAKAKEQKDKAAAREKKAKADESRSKELGKKEKAQKEKQSKERSAKERNSKESSHWWHGWINGWDGNMGWHVSGSTFVSGLHSTHSNHREDRLFNPLLTTIGTSQRSHHWSG